MHAVSASVFAMETDGLSDLELKAEVGRLRAMAHGYDAECTALYREHILPAARRNDLRTLAKHQTRAMRLSKLAIKYHKDADRLAAYIEQRRAMRRDAAHHHIDNHPSAHGE